MYFIGFSGAHRTGKTTTAVSVSKELGEGFQFIETNISSVLAKYGLDPKKEMSFSERLFIQDAILSKAVLTYEKYSSLSEESGRFFIFDRTPVDYLAYLLADVPSTGLSSEDEARLERFSGRCTELMNQYFLKIIFFQQGIEASNESGKAVISFGYQSLLDFIMKGVLLDERVLVDSNIIPQNLTRFDLRVEFCKSRLIALKNNVSRMAG
ncbi:MAG: hypothetical protein IBX55_01045 [Methyloprofundus sp.]|nr:hypothetical protein [Methyloprofundus sp.]